MSAGTHDVSFKDRQHRLDEALQETDLQGVVLNAGPSLTYLTGLHFHLSERPVVAMFTPGKPPVIVLPELEAGKLADLSYPVEQFTYNEKPETWAEIFNKAMRAAELPGKKVGIEPRRLRVLELNFLDSRELAINYVPGDACLEQIRIRKDEVEIEAMQAAANIAQDALLSTIPLIKPGITERELAAELTIQLLRHGSDSQLPFSPIIASGPNSANPHAFPGDRRLQEGDMLIIDWGANVVGYFSDLTRTFSLGEAEDEMMTIAQIVNQANKAAREKASPGIAAHTVDQAARQVIEEAGYGQYFIHRTGHGLGLESHEAPYIRDGNPRSLEPGMTFTIEPGIYLPGRGGVRIEDDVVITDQGLHSFSDLPRELNTLDI
ncbi:MAG: aminopeptidase P family protein [Anaerolineales bacterium]|nr:aminopeptidase P family protein [Anaerolineales bacterium]